MSQQACCALRSAQRVRAAIMMGLLQISLEELFLCLSRTLVLNGLRDAGVHSERNGTAMESMGSFSELMTYHGFVV